MIPYPEEVAFGDVPIENGDAIDHSNLVSF